LNLKKGIPGNSPKWVPRGSKPNPNPKGTSLSVLAKIEGLEMITWSTIYPNSLKENPIGNFAEALKNGMEFKS